MEQEEVKNIPRLDFGTLLAMLDEVFRPSDSVRTRDFLIGRAQQLGECITAIQRPGAHIALYGDRGVGKTSVANIIELFHKRRNDESQDHVQVAISKQCDSGDTYESVWRKLFREYVATYFSIDANGDTIELQKSLLPPVGQHFGSDDVVSALRQIGGVPLIIIDEFDRLPESFNRRLFADTIKAISDQIPSVTLMIVGVANDIATLLGEHGSIARNLVQIKMPVMSDDEIGKIIDKGLDALGMTMDAGVKSDIEILSCGYPAPTHLLCNHACRSALLNESMNVDGYNFRTALKSASTQAQEDLRNAYEKATTATKKNIYKEVLWAIANVGVDDNYTFRPIDLVPIVAKILGHHVTVNSFLKHLGLFCTKERGNILTAIGSMGRTRYKLTNPVMRPFLLLKYQASQQSPPETPQ